MSGDLTRLCLYILSSFWARGKLGFYPDFEGRIGWYGRTNDPRGRMALAMAITITISIYLAFAMALAMAISYCHHHHHLPGSLLWLWL